jgi:hypothetical protein
MVEKPKFLIIDFFRRKPSIQEIDEVIKETSKNFRQQQINVCRYMRGETSKINTPHYEPFLCKFGQRLRFD